MHRSRLRAPLRVLEEVLGEPDPDGADKSSTVFEYVFEGETLVVSDVHHAEWGGVPECQTDPAYAWHVDGDSHDVSRFCRWLCAEVQRGVPPELAQTYRWPLPGDPEPTPPTPPKPPPRAVAPKVRARNAVVTPPPPPLEPHRRRIAAVQLAFENPDPVAMAELRADLRRRSPDAQALAELLAAEPELSEDDTRTRIGVGFERARDELDALLRALR
jgi:hypothetical protein